MRGRVPGDIRAIQPIRAGQIQDYEVTEALIVHLLRQIHGRNNWMSPRFVLTMPAQANEAQWRAARECCEAAGAREVHLIPSALAAAIGAGLPIGHPAGHMVVDIGGGRTTVSVLSLNGVVVEQTRPGGGEGMDSAIISYLRDHHGLLVGSATAEQLKIDLGCATIREPAQTRIVKGRCMKSGLPRAQTVSSTEIHAALASHITNIGQTILSVLEAAPPELASDIVDHGVVLVGGGSQLTYLDRALRVVTGLSVVLTENANFAAVRGAGHVLEDAELLRTVCT